jgi:hypothetical protein
MLTGLGIDYPLYLTHWQVGPCDIDITAAMSVVVLTSTADSLTPDTTYCYSHTLARSLLSVIISFGIKESAHFNGLIVGTTIFSILFIIILGTNS